jgi:hypothetical protein
MALPTREWAGALAAKAPQSAKVSELGRQRHEQPGRALSGFKQFDVFGALAAKTPAQLAQLFGRAVDSGTPKAQAKEPR